MSYLYGYAIYTDFNQCTIQIIMEKADYNCILIKIYSIVIVKKVHQAIKNKKYL